MLSFDILFDTLCSDVEHGLCNVELMSLMLLFSQVGPFFSCAFGWNTFAFLFDAESPQTSCKACKHTSLSLHELGAFSSADCKLTRSLNTSSSISKISSDKFVRIALSLFSSLLFVGELLTFDVLF